MLFQLQIKTQVALRLLELTFYAIHPSNSKWLEPVLEDSPKGILPQMLSKSIVPR